MASASSLLTSVSVQCLSYPRNEGFFAGQFRPTNLIPARRPLRRLNLAFARRRRTDNATSSKKTKKRFSHNNSREEDDMDDDAFEDLFKQLEEDLKNDTSSMDDDDDDEITEEDFAMLEHALVEALQGDDDDIESDDDAEGDDNDDDEEERALEVALEDDDKELSNSVVDNIESDTDDDDDDDNDDDDEIPVKLKNWQLRRLASALKVGRRKTSIKLLAAELCLDRAVVLEYLREPPPELLMLSATLPDEPTPPVVSVPETKPAETVPAISDVEYETKVDVPVHVKQRRWSTQKRLKMAQAQTLERVYRKTKRPTNAMISSIVQVTNLPRKRVVKWFEDKRAEDGVPENRAPYERSVPETLSSQ